MTGAGPDGPGAGRPEFDFSRPCTAYLAAEGFVAEVVEELGLPPERVRVCDRLVLAEGEERPVAFARNVWRNPVLLPIASIADGARRLAAVQRNWALYSFRLHRRARLIAQRLPKVSARPLIFGRPAPQARLGSWTLWDEHAILAAAEC